MKLKFQHITLALILVVAPLFSFSQKNASFSVYFKNDSASLNILKQKLISSFIDTILKNELTDIKIYAYCSDKGASSYNDSLSVARAQYIKSVLLKSNISPSLISKCEGKGEIKSSSSRQSQREKEWSQNRKADILVSFIEPIPKIEDETSETNETQPYKSRYALRKQNVLDENSEIGDKITLENILFIGGRAELLPESYPALEKLVLALKEYKNYDFLILGHICCTVPGKDGRDKDTGLFNLSEARAKRIYNYLIEHDIEKDRLDYKGMKGDYSTGRGDKYDRRVEIEISGIRDKKTN